MQSPSGREGGHSMLNTIVEGFDEENWSNSALESPKSAIEPDLQAQQQEEADLRTRLRRETTETLISNLYSLKPAPVVDTRLIEDLSKGKLKVSIRNLLTEVNRVGKESDALYRTLHPESIALNFITSGSGSTRQRRASTHRARSSSVTGGAEMVRDRDIIPELRIRDLRQLESHFNHHEEPYVLIRRHCVLISLGPHVRVIVQSRRLLILVHQEEDESESGEVSNSQTLLHLLADTVQDLMRSSRLGSDLMESSNANNHATAHTTTSPTSSSSSSSSAPAAAPAVPFEVRAYVALFTLHLSLLTKEYNTLLCRSKSMIASISDHTMLSVGLQEFMHTNHDNVVDLQGRVSGTRRMIQRLLEEQGDDEELLFLNLHCLHHNPAIYGMPSEEAAAELYNSFSDIEAIIEGFLVDFRALETQSEVLVRKLTHVEQSINLKLDTSRNELLFATTILSVFATVISFSGYITGVFGMNLDNTEQIQRTPGVFYAVFATTMVMIAMGAAGIILVFRRYHWLPSHAHLHSGVEQGTFRRKLGDRKNSLEATTKNMLLFSSS